MRVETIELGREGRLEIAALLGLDGLTVWCLCAAIGVLPTRTLLSNGGGRGHH